MFVISLTNISLISDSYDRKTGLAPARHLLLPKQNKCRKESFEGKDLEVKVESDRARHCVSA